MQNYLHALEQRLLHVARRAGTKLFLGLIAGFLASVGMGFLVFGTWQLARDAWGAVAGSFAVGGGFVGIGVVLLWIGTLHKGSPPPVPPPAYSSPQSASIVALVEAFMLGMNAAKRKKPDDKED